MPQCGRGIHPTDCLLVVDVRYLMTFWWAESYCSWLTPMTNIGASGDGADTTTFLAPPWRCRPALSTLVKQPVDSTTYSAPSALHGISFGSRLRQHTSYVQNHCRIKVRKIFSVSKVKYTSICIAHFYAKRLKCAQTWITQFYLQIQYLLNLFMDMKLDTTNFI